MPTIRSIARYLVRTNRLTFTSHVDDVIGIVAAECAEWLAEMVADPTKIDGIRRSFDGVLYLRCRPKVKSYADGAASGRPSGTVALARRLREAERTRDGLRASLNREPTTPEVVEATNARMAATRKNPQRQGMLVRVEDLQTDVVTFELDDLDTPAGATIDDDLIATHEALATIRSVVEAADSIDEEHGKIARAWIAGIYDPNYQDVRTSAEIAALVGLPTARVRRVISRLRSVARGFLARELAVTDETYLGRPGPDSAAAA
ncbi:hypothetical protein ACFT2C_06180 [Promicromonospora sp. NPDC057138]|uniref:hypothetical protein n=1 Tax=Promicromonospora sp. NPDC057138 TaxID=3346031 RepID=UPI00362A9D65